MAAAGRARLRAAGPAPTAALTAAVLTAVLLVPSLTLGAPLVEGRPAPRTLTVPRQVTVVDLEASERARRLASEAVGPVLVADLSAQAAAVAAASASFEAVRSARMPVQIAAAPLDAADGAALAGDAALGDAALGDADPGDAVEGEDAPPERPVFEVPPLPVQVEALVAAGWDVEAAELLVLLDDLELAQLEAETLLILRELLRGRLTQETLAVQVEATLAAELALLGLPEPLGEQVVAGLVRRVAVPTVRVDEEATASARQAAAEQTPDATVTFLPGDPLSIRGVPVSAVQMLAAVQLGLVGEDVSGLWPRLALVALALALLLGPGVASAPLSRVRSSHRRLRVWSALLVVYALALAAALALRSFDPVLLWTAPSAPLALLLAATLGARSLPAAALSAGMLSLAAAPARTDLAVFAVLLTLSLGALALRLPGREQLRRLAGLAALSAGAAALLVFWLFPQPATVPSALSAAFASAISAALWTLVSSAALPMFEGALRVATGPGLAALADRNHPLLRRLERDALGTYQHSVMVSQLVAAALERVGGDTLLGTVQALYHDIGKVSAPYFFIENQFGVSNPHDAVAPEVSARIIHAHVSDGVELATTFSLPVEVVDGIATHHGTLRVESFYRTALLAASDGEAGAAGVDEALFRYPGPRPFTLETAVLMLADCCEGAVRAAAQAGGQRLDRDAIDELVGRLFDDRLDDGQLDEAPVTRAQLVKVRAAIVDTLEGVYHPRVVYPQLPA